MISDRARGLGWRRASSAQQPAQQGEGWPGQGWNIEAKLNQTLQTPP